jgi:hypothetical protein
MRRDALKSFVRNQFARCRDAQNETSAGTIMSLDGIRKNEHASVM